MTTVTSDPVALVDDVLATLPSDPRDTTAGDLRILATASQRLGRSADGEVACFVVDLLVLRNAEVTDRQPAA